MRSNFVRILNMSKKQVISIIKMAYNQEITNTLTLINKSSFKVYPKENITEYSNKKKS